MKRTRSHAPETEREFRPPVEHPLEMMSYLAMAGVIMLFVGLSLSYIFTRQLQEWQLFSLPRVFWLSTFFALACSSALAFAPPAYMREDAGRLRNSLLFALAAAAGFMACQIAGWTSVARSGLAFADTTSGSYLYLITGLHAAHVLVGIAFLGVGWWRVLKGTRDEVSRLLFFSDPARTRRLRTTAAYWHVVDALWLYLFLFFLFFHA